MRRVCSAFAIATGVWAAFSAAAMPVLHADSVASRQRTATKIADGVYVIRHKDPPDHFLQGNTAVIIGSTGVLVVDSCYLPSSAREDIAQIRQWTDKPVRYLLNTHWHNDHNQGNAAYAEAFPALTIIAQTETAKAMAFRESAYLREYPQRIATFQRQLDTGIGPDGKPLTDAEKEDLKNAVAGGKAANDIVSAEFRNLQVRIPDLTFDRSLDLDLGGREVQIRFLGRGNTAGDAVVFLPKEKILVAGDLVDSPVPFLGSGFPSEEVATLGRVLELDFEKLVPGHGEVLTGKDFVHREIDLIQAAIRAVDREMATTSVAPRKRLDPITKAVTQDPEVIACSKKLIGDDPDSRDFFESWSFPELIEVILAERWPR